MRHGWDCRDEEPRLTVTSYRYAVASRAFVWLALLSLLAPDVDAAVPINVNLKSATLSNVLNDKKNTQPPSTSPQTSGKPRPQSREGTKQKSSSSTGGVSLDLSGKFQCHLLGDNSAAAADEERNVNHPQRTTAIFQCHNSWGHGVPSVHVGSHYNFGKVWYGATRLFTTMTWKFMKPPRIRESEGILPTSELVKETNNGYSNRVTTTIRRHQMQLRGDKGLLSAGDYGIELGVESSVSPQGDLYSKSAKLSSTANLRLETGGIGKENVPKVIFSISTNAAVNPRIRFVSQTTRFLGNDNNGSFFAARIPTPPQTMDDWMPDVKIAPNGRLMGKCHVGVGKRRKTGIRLLVSKQLDWNAWSGGASSENSNDNGDTHIRCELCNLNSAGDELASISVDTVLERIVEAAHMTLSHERIIYS